ncbi:uncharacterized protein LOC114517060 isoform X2 [Dendronephthya gigantea]|uniref:uncharacterized protein LOC114517060 isoform X2 n=1 Tax=Dendronephthya gigantea TaxID=151771 RepID=UPI00106C12FC|nr:uncharacterized protein LOC114517060 isoform X2 [Dendronephthya gigantea]
MIDQESLLLLNEETVKEMVSAIGPRQKLLYKLQEEKMLQAQSRDTPNASDNLSVEISPGSKSCTIKNHVLPASLNDNEEFSPKKFKAEFSIKTILESSSLGEEILMELKSEKLSRKNRLKMVQILVAEIITRFGDRPKADVKISMAKAVVNEFPFLKDEEGEGFEAWYTPGRGIHSATGWLEEKLRNVRRRTNKEKTTSICSSNILSAPHSNLVQIASLPAESNISIDEYEGMVEWLKYHIEPLNKIKDFLKKTAIKRASWIREHSELSVSDIVKEHPRLFDTAGMIEQDFSIVVPESVADIFLKWTPSFAEKVLNYASDQTNWRRYLSIDERQLNTVAKQNAAIMVLPIILPAGRTGKKRCSIDDALKAFIDVKPIGTNMPKYLEEESKHDPHILVTGNCCQPHQVFVVSSGNVLEKKNMLEAIDTCFKLFYILDINYPWECKTTWEFIQKTIYCLEDKVPHKTTPAVISMRAALKTNSAGNGSLA